MADLAEIEIGFDPTPAGRAVKSLNDIAVGAEKAEAAVEGFGRAAKAAAAEASSALERASRMASGAASAQEKAKKSATSYTESVMRQVAAIEKMMAPLREQERMLRAIGASIDKLSSASYGRAATATDQVTEATERMNRTLAETRSSMTIVATSMTTVGTASVSAGNGLKGAGEGLDRISRQGKGAGESIRLAGHQVNNLQAQLFDIAVMFQGGMSPLTILMTQGPQIYQALGDHPGGVAGSVKAIGEGLASMAARIGPVGIAIAGLTATAGAFWLLSSGDKTKSAEQALESYRDLLAELRNGYEGAADAADAFFAKASKEAPNVGLANIAGTRSEIAASLAREIENLIPKTQGFVTSFKDLSPELLAAQQRIRDLGNDLEAGRITAAQFREQIADVRLDPETPRKLVEVVDKLLDGSANARDLANALLSADAAAAQLSGRFGRFFSQAQRDAPAGQRTGLDILKTFDPDAFEDLRKGLEDQGKELTKATEESDKYTAAVDRQKASLNESLGALRLQVEHFGETEGAMAAARFAAEALAEAQRAATAAGQDAIDPALEDQIKRQAAEYGTLTDQLKKLNEEKRQAERLTKFDEDLEFRQAQTGRSEIERRVAQEMRTAGLEYGSAADAGREATLRYIVTLEDTQKSLEKTGNVGREAFEGIAEALLSGRNAMEGITNALAKFGQQMANRGFNTIMDSIFGTTQAASGGRPSAGGGFASSVMEQVSYAAPIGKVTRGALPPLVTGEGFNSGRASQVAGQSVPAQMWNFFAGKGLSRSQIAGILGNAKAESAFNPAAVGDAGHAFGLFQWNDRGPAMKRFVGDDWRTDIQGQLDFAWKELQTSESRAYRALLQATDVVSATEAFLGFERPSGYNTGVRNSHNYSGRVANAQAAYGQFGDGDLARAVEVGSINATRKVASGNVPGISVGGSSWGAQFDGVQNMSPMVSGSAGGGMFGGFQEFMKSPLFQGGMTALGAGMAGYQSGDPMGGALNGALAGLAMGNPLMAGVGAVAGPVGGKFGRKQRRAA